MAMSHNHNPHVGPTPSPPSQWFKTSCFMWRRTPSLDRDPSSPVQSSPVQTVGNWATYKYHPPMCLNHFTPSPVLWFGQSHLSLFSLLFIFIFFHFVTNTRPSHTTQTWTATTLPKTPPTLPYSMMGPTATPADTARSSLSLFLGCSYSLPSSPLVATGPLTITHVIPLVLTCHPRQRTRTRSCLRRNGTRFRGVSPQVCRRSQTGCSPARPETQNLFLGTTACCRGREQRTISSQRRTGWMVIHCFVPCLIFFPNENDRSSWN